MRYSIKLCESKDFYKIIILNLYASAKEWENIINVIIKWVYVIINVLACVCNVTVYTAGLDIRFVNHID